jgi:hypothetical protein
MKGREMIPNVLYKFLRTDHAEAMLRFGTVRVGTLFDFRAMEVGDEERGDGGEGKLLLHSDKGRRVYNSTAELPPLLRGMSIECGRGGIATEGENAVRFDFDGPDMFIYCISEAINDAALDDWGGAAVRIARPIDFLRSLDAAFRVEAYCRGYMVGPPQYGLCSYVDRSHNWHVELPPQWLMKPLRYCHQREYRVAWAVENARPLQPLIVNSSEVAAACERL